MCKKHLPKNVTRRDILRYTLAGAGIAALGPLGRGLLREATGAPFLARQQHQQSLPVIPAAGTAVRGATKGGASAHRRPALCP